MRSMSVYFNPEKHILIYCCLINMLCQKCAPNGSVTVKNLKRCHFVSNGDNKSRSNLIHLMALLQQQK